MRLAKLITITFFVSTAFLSAATADNWPNWRGPNFNGSSNEKGLPTIFSKEENVAWKTDLPGVGSSTPVVWGDAVFLTSVDEKQDGVVAIRIDADTGKVVWSRKFGEGTRQDERSTYAGPSAVTDGKLVYFFSGSGNLVALDFSGKQIWGRDIQKEYGPFAFGWTFSTSPVLYGGTLFLQVLQRNVPVNGKGRENGPNDSYILALDPATGKEKWRHVRPAKAVGESLESFTTPTPIVHAGREELLVIGGDCLTGHDPATGKELWRWGTWNHKRISHWRLVPSAVYGKGVILACAPKGNPVYAVNAGKNGTIRNIDQIWTSEGKQVTADVATPLFYDGYFYILNGRNKFLSCVLPKTGEIVWSERLNAKTKLEASPTGVDGKIYIMSHLGEVFVVKAGPDFELLNATTFGEEESTNIRSSIVPANGRIFIRTDSVLYCVK